jgi:hypothetical protein
MFGAFLALFKPRPPKKKNSRSFQQEGQCHDLKEIFNHLNQQYFENKLDLRIEWFGRQSFPKNYIRFGSYNQRSKVIKINRLLDQPQVPFYFVAFIVYHEMLHDAVPPIQVAKRRRSVHHRAFLEREKLFQEYGLAQEFLHNLKKHRFQPLSQKVSINS